MAPILVTKEMQITQTRWYLCSTGSHPVYVGNFLALSSHFRLFVVNLALRVFSIIAIKFEGFELGISCHCNIS